MFPVLFQLGPITLHTYGLLIAIGFLVGVSICRKTFAAAKLAPELVDRFCFLALGAGLLGARIMFFAVDGFAELRVDPLAFFRIWEGGLVFYGGVIGALIAIVVAALRTRVPLITLTDALVPPLLVAHAFGRLGCFAAGCCYGKISGYWPGVMFTNPETLAPPSVVLHPTQLYEAGGLALIFVAAMYLLKSTPPKGRMTWFYLVSYTPLRFFIETLRGDDRGMGIAGLSPSQVLSIVGLVAGIALYIYVERPNPKTRKS